MSTGGTAIQCDVTDRDAIERAFDEARAANGPIDFLILNAGIGDSAPFARTTARNLGPDHRHQPDGRFRLRPAGAARSCWTARQAADLRRLGRRAEGRALCRALCRFETWRGRAGAAAWPLEFAKTDLTVNAVCPSFVDTPMVDESADAHHRVTGRSEGEARDAIGGDERQWPAGHRRRGRRP